MTSLAAPCTPFNEGLHHVRSNSLDRQSLWGHFDGLRNLRPYLRGRRLRWGATPAEVEARLKLHPKAPALLVASVEPDRALVLHSGTDIRGGKSSPEHDEDSAGGYGASWLFYLEAKDDVTRLICRFRTCYPPGLGNALAYGTMFVEPIGFVMDRKMLLGIKRRTEQSSEGC